jgi:hypothetical protein
MSFWVPTKVNLGWEFVAALLNEKVILRLPEDSM